MAITINIESQVSQTITDGVTDKAPSENAVFDALSNKVDKETGKGLSEEDFTMAEKNKLAGIEAGAQVNVNADWNATTGDAEILNKPTIPSVTGLVPYTGAVADVDLGTHKLTAHNLAVNHPSGSGDAATITKGGNGEALKVVKSSGSGNAASITGGVTLLSELDLQTPLADAEIASAATWNAKIGGAVSIGQVAFGTAAGVIGGDAGFTWDNTNKRLGIGTSTPVAPFDINATGFTQFRIKNATFNQAAGVQMFNDLNIYAKLEVFGSSFGTLNLRNNTMLWSQGDLAFGSGLVTRQEVGRFTTAGFLGIGTSTPTARLHVQAQGALSSDIAFRVRNSADTLDIIRAQGDGSVFIGLGAGNVSTGANNTANGVFALRNNTTGINNTANGVSALQNNTTGANNTANGASAFFANTTGNNNTANGFNAGAFVSSGAAILISNNSVFLGAGTRALADNQTNQIVIGHNAIGSGSNTVTLGNTSIVKTILRGTLNAANLPTSATGLVAGDIWNDAGTLKIV